MQKVLHRADSRGHVSHGWLDTYHSFSFASWHNPERVRFGVLRVLNDDTVAPDQGFGMHPHDNMEIITIILNGQLKHRDSMGSDGVIKENEIQVMSAGKGVMHSEFNPSQDEKVELFQIWIFPREKNIEPRYDQMSFDPAGKENKLQMLVTSDKDSKDAMWINQDAYLSMGKFDAGKEIDYDIRTKGNGAYIMVVEGKVNVEGDDLSRRDAIGIYDTDKINIKVLEPDTEILIIEVPMN
ncbi:MAG: pirin family protein [Ignavibacteriae bacterium]|nr:pirin family protein [Ignavibacteriota bacterium]